MRLTRQHMHKPNHYVVSYERLVDDTPVVLAEVCGFLGVSYEESMLQNYGAAADQMVRNKNAWQSKAFQPIHNANGSKFLELFDENEQRYVVQHLTPIAPDEFDSPVRATS